MDMREAGMMRRAFLKGPAAAAVMLAAGPFARGEEVAGVTGQTVVVYRQGDVFKAMGLVNRKALASDHSASRAIQSVLDMFKQSRGGRLMLEPGVYPLDRPLRLFGNTSLQGSGASTVLGVTDANKEGVGIFCESENCVSISDMCIDGNLRANKTSVSGIVLDNCAEALLDRISCRDFNQYGFHIRNLCSLSRVHNCVGANNQISNFFLDYLGRPLPSETPEPKRVQVIGDFIPNIVADCYAIGGGNGFELANSLCQDLVGCAVYQPKGISFYVHTLSNSTLISGCRSFEASNQAVVIEDSNEINISSSIFCWQNGHGIELRNCCWGSISANEIIDSGASGVNGLKYGLYMHTDVKGVQVSGNTVFNWPGQGPTLSAVFEDEACRDNSIVSNSFNYYTTAEAVISKGTNTLVANNYARKEAFAHPAKTPFAKPHPDFRIAAFKRDGLEEYFHSRYSPMMSEK